MFSFKLEYKWCKINYMGKTTLKEKKPHFLWYDKAFQSVEEKQQRSNNQIINSPVDRL